MEFEATAPHLRPTKRVGKLAKRVGILGMKRSKRVGKSASDRVITKRNNPHLTSSSDSDDSESEDLDGDNESKSKMENDPTAHLLSLQREEAIKCALRNAHDFVQPLKNDVNPQPKTQSSAEDSEKNDWLFQICNEHFNFFESQTSSTHETSETMVDDWDSNGVPTDSYIDPYFCYDLFQRMNMFQPFESYQQQYPSFGGGSGQDYPFFQEPFHRVPQNLYGFGPSVSVNPYCEFDPSYYQPEPETYWASMYGSDVPYPSNAAIGNYVKECLEQFQQHKQVEPEKRKLPIWDGEFYYEPSKYDEKKFQIQPTSGSGDDRNQPRGKP